MRNNHKANGYDMYVSMYCRAKGIDIGGYKRALERTGGRSKFNRRFALIKDRNDWTDETIAGLAYYVFTHNPARFEKLTDYGYLDVLVQCVTAFNQWLIANESLVEELGILKAVARTIPDQLDRTCVLDEEELAHAYGA